MVKRQQIVQLSEEGYAYKEIAEKVGVSRQYVSQVLRKIKKRDFVRLTDSQCVYPGLRKWWNENRMTYVRFFERMGMLYHGDNMARLKRYLKGESGPRKDYIDKLISVTGLTYEQLFYKDGD